MNTFAASTSRDAALDEVLHTPLASLGRRTAAYLVDATILFCVTLAVSLTVRWLRIVGVWTPHSVSDPFVSWRSIGMSAKLAVVVAYLVATGSIYFAFFEASQWQSSIGKRLLRIHVTDEAGRRLRLTRSVARSFAKSFSILLQVAVVSLVTILVSSKKQALHDFATKTLVVSGEPINREALGFWPCIAAFGITFLWLVVTFVAVFRAVH
jgi:uncharacterized RDD family membrane protein YckC